MKKSKYIFRFKSGDVEVYAMNEAEAKILAQATAINRCWNYVDCICICGRL